MQRELRWRKWKNKRRSQFLPISDAGNFRDWDWLPIKSWTNFWRGSRSARDLRICEFLWRLRPVNWARAKQNISRVETCGWRFELRALTPDFLCRWNWKEA